MSGAEEPGTPSAAPSEAAPAGRRAALATGIALAALAGAGLAWWRSNSGAEVDLSRFWGSSFQMPGGDQVVLSALRGRPLLVNFWATWCPPCIDELPLLSDFYAENKANGWQLLGLAVDQLEPVQRFLARVPLTYPVGMARADGMDWMRELGNDAGGLPFTVVFSADGRLAYRKIGQLRPADLDAFKRDLAARG
jgi:thiol-disulfide isomerase/thioredoxin